MGEGFPDHCRDSDGGESVLRVEIGLSALIDHPNIAVVFSVRVWNGSVDLVQFQGRGVVRIVYADNVVLFAFV